MIRELDTLHTDNSISLNVLKAAQPPSQHYEKHSERYEIFITYNIISVHERDIGRQVPGCKTQNITYISVQIPSLIISRACLVVCRVNDVFSL